MFLERNKWSERSVKLSGSDFNAPSFITDSVGAAVTETVSTGI